MGHLRDFILRSALIPLQQVAVLRGTFTSEDRVRQDLVRFGAMLHSNGFVAATDGNLSVRLDSERVMITPTGFGKGLMDADDMVIIDFEGHVLQGNHNASSEAAMHLTIYRERPDIHAVVHAHPCTATAFACCGMSLEEPICAEVVMALGSVPLAPYATTGTPRLSETLRPYVLDHDAVLLANHGVVTCAPTLREAYWKMEAVEHFAKVTLMARQIGEPKVLNQAQLQELSVARQRYLNGCNSHRSIGMPSRPAN
jgi:L-fuculose-phosphate aldolase